MPQLKIDIDTEYVVDLPDENSAARSQAIRDYLQFLADHGVHVIGLHSWWARDRAASGDE